MYLHARRPRGSWIGQTSFCAVINELLTPEEYHGPQRTSGILSEPRLGATNARRRTTRNESASQDQVDPF